MASNFVQGTYYHRPFLHNIAHTLTSASFALTIGSSVSVHIDYASETLCDTSAFYGPLILAALVIHAVAYFLGIVASYYTNERSKRFPAIIAASFILVFISFILQIAMGAMDTVRHDNLRYCNVDSKSNNDYVYYGTGYSCNWAAVIIEFIALPFIFVLMFGGFKSAKGNEDIETSSLHRLSAVTMDDRPFSPEKIL